MATCPNCKKHFRVMEDEDPKDFDCPYCGYNPYECGVDENELDPEEEESGDGK